MLISLILSASTIMATITVPVAPNLLKCFQEINNVRYSRIKPISLDLAPELNKAANDVLKSGRDINSSAGQIYFNGRNCSSGLASIIKKCPKEKCPTVNGAKCRWNDNLCSTLIKRKWRYVGIAQGFYTGRAENATIVQFSNSAEIPDVIINGK